MAAALTARYPAYEPIPLVVPNTASPGAHAATSTRYSLKCQSSWRALASTATPIIERPARRDGQRLRGKIAFPELPDGIDDRRLANPTPCGIRKNKDQLFRSHNAESRMEHPAFAKHLQGLAAGVRFE